MKHEWRKKEKALYIAKTLPMKLTVPAMKYFTITGAGNPNDEFFKDYIEVLYALSYGIKMSPKRDDAPEGFYDYTVYPLEGVWDINHEAKRSDKAFNKDDLVFKLMIRQPDFVSETYALKTIEYLMEKKKLTLLKEVKFEIIDEGDCVQILHLGPYENEDKSFEIIQNFCDDNNLNRSSSTHREIYLSDFRKVGKDKLKTVLRVRV